MRMTLGLAAWVAVVIGLTTGLRAEVPVNAINSDGFLREWIVLGPFPSKPLAQPTPSGVTREGYDTDFLAPLGGEGKATIGSDTTVIYKDGSEDVVVRAQPVTAKPSGHVLHSDYDRRVGYAFCYVESDRDQPVYAYFASDGSPKVWINGELVFNGWEIGHKTTPWMYRRMVNLKQGRNPMLVKLDNDRGWWGFQTEFYVSAGHEAGILRGLKGFTVQQEPTQDDTLALNIELKPTPLDYRMPVQVSLTDPDGRVLATADGTTGQRITLKLPQGYHGPATAEVTSAPTAAKQLQQTQAVYVGDFAADRAAARTRFDAVKKDLSFLGPRWLRAYAGIVRWVDRWFEHHLNAVDAYDLANLGYIQNLTASLEQKRNLLANQPGASYPVTFEGTDSGGRFHQIDGTIRLPDVFGREDRDYPLIISLHGAGGVGMKTWFSPPSDQSQNRSPLPFIRISPRRPEDGYRGWEPPMLNAVLGSTRQMFSIDEDRIYLTGHSMGGNGTFRWATANPELFAAIAPKAGWGMPIHMARLKHVPIWAFHGEKDDAVVPYRVEVCLSALQDAGGTVRYSLYSDAGHGLEAQMKGEPLEEWFAQHTRSKEPAPPSPLHAIQFKDGVSDIQIKTLPAQRVLVCRIEGSSKQLDTLIGNAMLDLYNTYRRNGRLARGYIIIQHHKTCNSQAGQLQLDLLLPVEINVDTTLSRIQQVTLKEARVASFYFYGKKQDLPAAHQRALDQLQQKGIATQGEWREVLLNSDYDDVVLREVQIMLK